MELLLGSMTKIGNPSYPVDPDVNVTNDGHKNYKWNAFDQLTNMKTVVVFIVK